MGNLWRTNKQGKANRNRNRNSRKEQRVEGKQGVRSRILNAMTQGLTSASRRSVNIIHLTGCEKYGLNMANNVMKLIQKPRYIAN